MDCKGCWVNGRVLQLNESIEVRAGDILDLVGFYLPSSQLSVVVSSFSLVLFVIVDKSYENGVLSLRLQV